MWCYIFVLFSCLYVCNCSNSRIVETAQGPVRGYEDDGVYAFYSIPYAKAPSGRDRFKAPLPASMRSSILEAIDKGIVCPQSRDLWGILNRDLVMTEDCLIANVFVPDTSDTNLPVLVYVHGGGFVLGHGNFLLYKNFIRSHKIIVITFNYRLGAHGFLCLGTKNIPGNAGMKDQVALLRWVKDNIMKFGGNPDDITIAGGSAGSASVHLLMLSDTTRGLFQKVIPESGASIASWSIQNDPIWTAKTYAEIINFTNYNNLSELENFFTTVSYEILNSEGFSIMQDTHASFSLSPCIEIDTEGEEFLTDSPVNIIKIGNYHKVPILFGFANMEGLMRKDSFQEWKELMNDNFVDFLPQNLEFKNEEEKISVAKQIKEFYFGSGTIQNEDILNYINFFSDIVIAYPTLRSIKLHIESGHDKIYLYEYSFVDENLPIIPHTNIRGADHCAQSLSVGDGNLTHPDDILFPQKTREMKKVVRNLWSNFVKSGEPVPKGSEYPAWSPVGKDWSPHMVIDDPLRLAGSLLKERTMFWEKIYEKYYRHPTTPQSSSTNTFSKHTEL